MLWSNGTKIGKSDASVCVRAYLFKHVEDLYTCAVDEGGWPSNFLSLENIYKDYIAQGYSVSVTFDQFVKALRRLKTRRCYVNKYKQHILVGHRLGLVQPVAEETTTTVV